MREVMKPNKIIQLFRLEKARCRVWAVLAVALIVVDSVDSIRVYEGTNIPAPTPKSSKLTGLSKKSLYISKRSWNGAEEKLVKTDGKGDGKWKEITKKTGNEGAPSLYKIRFTDQKYLQYLKYIKDVPRLEEYTFCLWFKSHNLTNEQTLFSYSLNKNELLLRFWVNPKDSTLGMSIRENLVYKVPANVRTNKWHHICQSWNGVLGEWQVFLDGKRIGAGVLSRISRSPPSPPPPPECKTKEREYKGTYIPEGGEVTLGQELIGLSNRLNDRMDGEIFGFNLVDEAVPQDQGVFINSQYRPNVQAGVPPFKKLPPIKKTYQEIKAYITALPSDPSELRKKNEGYAGETSNAIKKQKETPKRNRGNQRPRYPPVRKVVVYNRDDRQLGLDEGAIELNKTKPAIPAQNQTAVRVTAEKKEAQPLDENYSIHSYRSGKDERRAKNYEIYEAFEDDGIKTDSEDELTSEQSLERKARQNFNLFTARQANKVYTLSSSVKDSKKRKFHFETRTEEPEKTTGRLPEEGRAIETATKRTASDTIPVYEVEVISERRKRSADGKIKSRQFITVTEDPRADSNGFRRLPQIPESFINIFTQNASKSEMEHKLDQFFPKSNTSEKANVIAEIAEGVRSSPNVEAVAIPLPATNAAQIDRFTTKSPVPIFSPIPQKIQTLESSEVQQPVYTTPLTNPGPVSFPSVEFNPRPPPEQMRTSVTYNKPAPQTADPVSERRRFEVSSGTDLVMRSYGECTTDRGSPIKDKKHLIVSWADTPVRIFGGAQVEGARNQCGYF